MSQKLFLVTAGGTGMRCLQSFINLCALGMFPNTDIDILLLETDEENKDKKNTENLIQYYKKIQGSEGSNDSEDRGVGEFFSANINLYVFVPDYSTEETRNFVVLSQVERGNSETNRMLANIFYEEGVQEFNLAHGYRAQTHLGSYLMYHAFIDEIRKSTASDEYGRNSDLFKFIKHINSANQVGAKVFSLGSSFGGTGASSIPVVPRAISDSCKIISDDKIKMENIYYGAVVLSSYFNFPPPSDAHKKKDKIIADSQFFQHNSAAALMYYVNDTTILKTYKRLYMLGWGDFKLTDTQEFKNEYAEDTGGSTVTGGKKQQNPAHILELFGAMAAKHFFDEATTKTEELTQISSTEFKYKSLESEKNETSYIPSVKFQDLYSTKGDENNKGERATHEKIRDNFTAFFSIGCILKKHYKGDITSLFNDLRLYNSNYDKISDDQIEGLNRFFEYFTDIPNQSSSEQTGYYPGWFKQIYKTFHATPKKGDGPNEKSFFGLSKESFLEDEWWKNYMELRGLKEEQAKDKFISLFKKTNKNKPSGNNKNFLIDIRNTFFQLKTYDAGASENLETTK